MAKAKPIDPKKIKNLISNFQDELFEALGIEADEDADEDEDEDEDEKPAKSKKGKAKPAAKKGKKAAADEDEEDDDADEDEDEDDDGPTLNQLRALAVKASKATDGKEKVLAALKAHGNQRLTEIDEDEFASLKKMLDKIIADDDFDPREKAKGKAKAKPAAKKGKKAKDEDDEDEDEDD